MKIKQLLAWIEKYKANGGDMDNDVSIAVSNEDEIYPLEGAFVCGDPEESPDVGGFDLENELADGVLDEGNPVLVIARNETPKI